MRRHLTYANAMTTILAVLVLGGATVYATTIAPRNSVVSKSIKNGQVKKADLANGAVSAKKLAADALQSKRLLWNVTCEDVVSPCRDSVEIGPNCNSTSCGEGMELFFKCDATAGQELVVVSGGGVNGASDWTYGTNFDSGTHYGGGPFSGPPLTMIDDSTSGHGGEGTLTYNDVAETITATFHWYHETDGSAERCEFWGVGTAAS